MVLSSPFTDHTFTNKAQLDVLVSAIAALQTDYDTSYIDVTQTTGPTISNSGTTIVTGWATRASNNPPSYSSGTWTVQSGDDGLYSIIGQLTYVASSDGHRLCDLLISGNSFDHQEIVALAGVKNQMKLAWSGPLAVGDTIAVRTSQTASTSTTLGTGLGDCHLTIARLGPA